MSSLVTTLLHASAAMDGLAGQTGNGKVAGQLLMLRMAFVDTAQQLRNGHIVVPAEALAACIKEVEDARVAAAGADGSQDDGKYSLVIVEGNEALAVIQSQLRARADSAELARAFGLGGGLPGGLTPIPPEGGPTPFPIPLPHPFPWPRPWPPFPFPPRPWPWPWPPGPWDLQLPPGWDGSIGFPGTLRR